MINYLQGAGYKDRHKPPWDLRTIHFRPLVGPYNQPPCTWKKITANKGCSVPQNLVRGSGSFLLCQEFQEQLQAW